MNRNVTFHTFCMNLGLDANFNFKTTFINFDATLQSFEKNCKVASKLIKVLLIFGLYLINYESWLFFFKFSIADIRISKEIRKLKSQ